MTRYFDTHAHLTRKEFSSDIPAVVRRMTESGVEALTAGTCYESSVECVKLAERFGNVYAAVGVHPNDVSAEGLADFDRFAELCDREKVVAIGETGLDYFWDRTDPELQKRFLEKHFELALEKKLPVILHARKSEDDLLEMVKPFIDAGGRAVWHCFVSGKKHLRARLDRALEMGLYLGLGGMVTFEDQKPLREIIPRIPDRHILLETDCPFLIPRPREEGEGRNEPARVIRVAEELAVLRGVSQEDIARVTTRNAYEFLGFNARDIENESERIAYPIRNSLYVNPTNACNNNCGFCARNRGYVVKGHDIRLDHDPSAEEMLAAMGDFTKYDEVVFCGFGEPTLRLEEILAVARKVKDRGQKVRLNSNGMANLQHGRDVTEDFVGLVDVVSVSLNTADPEQYERLCSPRFGGKAYVGMCDFVKACVARGIRTICTVVDMPEIDIEAARARAVELGAEFRVRSFVDAG